MKRVAFSVNNVRAVISYQIANLGALCPNNWPQKWKGKKGRAKHCDPAFWLNLGISVWAIQKLLVKKGPRTIGNLRIKGKSSLFIDHRAIVGAFGLGRRKNIK